MTFNTPGPLTIHGRLDWLRVLGDISVWFKSWSIVMSEEANNLIELTADIVSAYVQKNPVPVAR
ncbi:hypothetical protein FJ974_17730 [Mesorhizobium sp. B1-1-8]|nr:hypothetical protein FJ974_17730 [Mesorhizobium sp. B1-1-8]